MSLKEAQVDALWRKLKLDVSRKGADIKGRLVVDGKHVIRTYRSQGRGKLDGEIQHKIRTQMKLNEDEFKDALDCPLDYAGYLAILKRKGLL